MNIKSFAFACLIVGGLSSNASATVVNDTFLRADTNSFESLALDPTTGIFYSRAGYYQSNTVEVYGNSSAFAAGTPSSSFSLGTNTVGGTYIAANNGVIYGRSTNGI